LFSMSFDEASMKEISLFAGLGILLTEEMQQAEQQVGQLIIQRTQDNGYARFAQNSPGGLAESFVMTNVSPYEIEVGSDKPYAHRRDAGFDGADSLGRVYHDQPTWFFSDAVNSVSTDGSGMELLQGAAYAALARMGIGGY
jgi:hypothetical protein